MAELKHVFVEDVRKYLSPVQEEKLLRTNAQELLGISEDLMKAYAPESLWTAGTAEGEKRR